MEGQGNPFQRGKPLPWYQPRTKSQAIAWGVSGAVLVLAAVIYFGPKIGGDETTVREYLVTLLLGAMAVVLAIYVADRLKLQAGKELVPRVVLPWRRSLRTEETLLHLGAPLTQSEGRIHLAEVDLHEASLPAVDLRAADLSEASLRNANLGGANLQQADLNGADLRGADLRRANLAWSSLIGASLEGARLERSILFGANLKQANLKDATFAGAAFDRHTYWPEDFFPIEAGAEPIEWGD